MDTALKYILIVWSCVGFFLLVAFLIICVCEGKNGKWGSLIWALVVYLTGGLIIAGGGQGMAGSLFDEISAVYDVNKNTAEFLKILEAKPQNWVQVFILSLYCYGKILAKLIAYNIIVYVFGGKPKFWKPLFIGHALLMIVAVFCILGLDPYALIKNEGFISVIILIVIILPKTIFGIGKKPDPPKVRYGGGEKPSVEKGGRSIMAVAFFFMVTVLAAAFVLAFEARTLRKLDEIVFQAVLGG